MRHATCLLAFLPVWSAASLAAQSTVTQHGEIVFGAGRPMPGSLGASPNDFPAGAVMATGLLTGTAVQPVIDAEGGLLFVARARGDAALGITGSNSQALLYGRGGQDLRLLLRQDDPIPGLPSTTHVSDIAGFRISPFGAHILIGVHLQDDVVPANTPVTADTALLLGQPGAWQVLMREGDLVPAVGGGARYGEIDLQGLSVTSTGTAVFRNNLQTGVGGVTTVNDAILQIGTPGNLTIVARNGSPWNGSGATGEVVDRSVAITSFVVTNARLLDDGRIVHDLKFVPGTGSATATTNDRVLAVWQAGVDTVLAREGDQAPGMPPGAVFADSGLSPFTILPVGAVNRAGVVAFSVPFPAGPGGVTAADDRAVFVHDGTSLTMVLREGNPAPLGAGITFGHPAFGMVLTNGGQLAFGAALGGNVTAGNDSALLLGPPGTLTAIAREGDPVPGLPGHFFGDLAGLSLGATERNDLLCLMPVSNGIPRNVAMQYTAQHGWRPFFDTADPFVGTVGTTTLPTTFGATLGHNADGTQTLMNSQGDVAFAAAANGSEATTIGCTYVRCHVGTMIASPAVVPASGGVPQTFAIDCGPGQANRFYLVLATGLGTRPGFPSPLGPQLVPLNYDSTWTSLSLSLLNSAIWSGTFGFTDAAGKGVGPAAFTPPTGVPALAGLRLHHAAVLFDLTLASQFVTEPSGLLLQ